MTTIVLADDHQIVRQGLRALLEAEPEFSVTGEASDGLEVAALVEQLEPDVLLLDIKMPGLNGLEVTRQVRRRTPNTNVVILSMYASEACVMEALRNGAVGYVLKGASAADLVQAVKDVAEGRRYLSPPLSERAIEAYVQKAVASTPAALETLTDRGREVLHFVVEGYKNSEIATKLEISPRTAETHRARMMRKLDLHTQADLMRFAIQLGLFPVEE